MPVRPRLQAVAEREPSPLIFRVTDGTWDFFDRPCVYRDRARAERAWKRNRRPAWAASHRFSLPAAAMAYDYLTCDGWRELWQSLALQHFQADAVLDAIAADERAIDAFIERDPKGARMVADYLVMWREDVATIRQAAEDCARYADDWIARSRLNTAHRITSKHTYGDGGDTDGDV